MINFFLLVLFIIRKREKPTSPMMWNAWYKETKHWIESNWIDLDRKLWMKCYYENIYLKTIVSSMAPRHWTILFCITLSTFSSKWRFGSCLPTFLIANCSGVIFSSSSRAYNNNKNVWVIRKRHKSWNIAIIHLIIVLGQLQHLLYRVFIDGTMFIVIGQGKTILPGFLV